MPRPEIDRFWEGGRGAEVRAYHYLWPDYIFFDMTFSVQRAANIVLMPPPPPPPHPPGLKILGSALEIEVA